MYLTDDNKLHISIDEVKSRKYDVTKLLTDEVDNISKKIICDYNRENQTSIRYNSVWGMVEGKLIINVVK